MPDTLSNRDLKEWAEILFAHGPELYAPGLFVGRADETAEVRAFLLNGQPGSVLVISEPLGAGKTWLLRHVIRELQRTGELSSSRRGEPLRSIRRFDSPESMADAAESGVLALDEADRKMQPKDLFDKLSYSSGLLGPQLTKLIVAGDQSLGDVERLKTTLGRTEEQICFVRLAALDRGLLSAALAVRAGQYEGLQPYAASIDEMFRDCPFGWLIPQSSPPVATFRGVLSILSMVAESRAIPLNARPAQFSTETFRLWASSQPPVTDDPQQVAFLIALRDLLQDAVVSGRRVTAMSTGEWLRECPVRGIRNAAAFEKAILRPLDRTGWMQGLGVPDFPTGDARGPYVPSLLTFVRAGLDPNWP